MGIRAPVMVAVIVARKSSSRSFSSKKYVFMSSVNIFFRAHTNIRPLGGDRLPHNATTTVYRTGVITSLTIHEIPRHRGSPGSDFERSLNYLHRSIGCALPCQSAALHVRATSECSTWQGRPGRACVS